MLQHTSSPQLEALGFNPFLPSATLPLPDFASQARYQRLEWTRVE